ncbi:MAG TPA: hypothetical protein VEF53_00420 [Patescibacteria group bacterium]|nr:hypothetical protein [Patescibacteria group bacterium]
MNQTKHYSRGSITIEAAIVLPVFICVVISLAMLIKLVYIHDIIQHSIDEAANELAAYAYIYHISDIKEIDDSIQENLGEHAEQAEEHIEAVVDAFDTLENVYTRGSDFVEEVDSTISSETSFISKANQVINQASKSYREGQQISQQGIDAVNNLYEVFEEVGKNPKAEAESLAWMLSKGLYSDAKTIIAVPVVKYTVKKYLQKPESEDLDSTLRKLNVYNGFNGLDFYSSTFFQENEDIDIVVKYRVELPLPVQVLPEIYMVQRSTARAWLNGGDGTSMKESSIWDLPNKQRGMKIEELYGGNLPFDFPYIDIYDSASKTGTSIKSINLNSKSYQDKANLNRMLKQYVEDIGMRDTINYKQEKYDIKVKKLIFVIPKGSINEHNRDVLEQVKSYADHNGIDLTISEL